MPQNPASSLYADIGASTVPDGAVRMWWLGQAGFVFKTSAGKVILLDPYLSDACERLHGFKRLSLPPVRAEDVRADLVLLTHEHTDHLDPDAVPVIARNNSQCLFAGPAGCRDGIGQADIADARFKLLEPTRRYELCGVVIHTAQADHGDLSPTALAFVLDFGSVRVMVSGDTSWRPVVFKPLCDMQPQVVIAVINGTFGNMNHLDAAMLVDQARPRLAVPCHFWMFAEQGGCDPGGFINACARQCPNVKVQLFTPGEGLTVTQD